MGRYTGFVYERQFQISKKLFRNKWNVIMIEVCGYETVDEITTKNRTTILSIDKPFRVAARLRKNFEVIEKKEKIKTLNELIKKAEQKTNRL